MQALSGYRKRVKCESIIHSNLRLSEYFTVRNYHNEIEQHICQGCLTEFRSRGYLTYTDQDGFMPVAGTVDAAIAIFSGKVG